jgi:hypothetical protein
LFVAVAAAAASSFSATAAGCLFALHDLLSSNIFLLHISSSPSLFFNKKKNRCVEVREILTFNI